MWLVKIKLSKLGPLRSWGKGEERTGCYALICDLGSANVEHTMTLRRRTPGRAAGAWRHPIWHEASEPLAKARPDGEFIDMPAVPVRRVSSYLTGMFWCLGMTMLKIRGLKSP